MTPARLDFTIYRGITFNPLIFNAKDGSGNAIDLTGWQVFAESRNGYGLPINLGPTITSAGAGQISIDLTKEETATFKSGEQDWDMVFQKPTGEKLGPYISGKITVKDVVSNA